MTPARPLASRWWALAVVAVVVVCGVILGFVVPSTPAWWVAATALALYVVAFAAFGRRAVEGSRSALLFVAVGVLVTGTVVSVEPSLAVFQALAMPTAWVLTISRRAAIAANAFVAGAAGTGFFVSLGFSPAATSSAALTVLFSFAGSVALGLWIYRIADDAEERARLLDELTAAQDELAALHRDAGVTDERQRLARELHDTIAQTLAGTVLLAQRARRELATGALSDATLGSLEDAAREALTETRTLVAGSAPVELGAGLAGALEVLAERFRRESGASITVSVALDAPLQRGAEVALLRCAQEGLANVRKHAGASSVAVTLDGDGADAVLRVTDDGRGLDPAAIPDGFGLSGLRARLALVGGSLAVSGSA
ncbi:sensor histidine kinase, partial [Pseudolysinimonas sp.]